MEIAQLLPRRASERELKQEVHIRKKDIFHLGDLSEKESKQSCGVHCPGLCGQALASCRDVNAGIWRRWYAGVGGLCDTVPQRFLALITEQVKSVVLDEMLF